MLDFYWGMRQAGVDSLGEGFIQLALELDPGATFSPYEFYS